MSMGQPQTRLVFIWHHIRLKGVETIRKRYSFIANCAHTFVLICRNDFQAKIATIEQLLLTLSKRIDAGRIIYSRLNNGSGTYA